MPSSSIDTMQQRLVTVSHRLALADRKGKCLFLRLPVSCPSHQPSVTFFLLSLSLTPLLPPSSPPCLSLPISTANFSCVVYRHVRAWLNSGLGHDSALETSFLCVICTFSACFFVQLKGRGARTSVCRYAHRHVVAKLEHLYAWVPSHKHTNKHTEVHMDRKHTHRRGMVKESKAPRDAPNPYPPYCIFSQSLLPPVLSVQ